VNNLIIEKALHEQLDRLPLEQQRQVLEFARALAVTKVRGVPGSSLARFAGSIDPEDIEAMSRAINEGCEKVNSNEW
jgi:hypothetical protein